MIMPNHKIRTADQMSQESNSKALMEAGNELKELNENYAIQQKSTLAKYRDFKKNSATTLNFLDRGCDFFEKSKNLLYWNEPKMSTYFFFFLIVVFFIVTFIPLRFFIFLYCKLYLILSDLSNLQRSKLS